MSQSLNGSVRVVFLKPAGLELADRLQIEGLFFLPDVLEIDACQSEAEFRVGYLEPTNHVLPPHAFVFNAKGVELTGLIELAKDICARYPATPVIILATKEQLDSHRMEFRALFPGVPEYILGLKVLVITNMALLYPTLAWVFILTQGDRQPCAPSKSDRD